MPARDSAHIDSSTIAETKFGTAKSSSADAGRNKSTALPELTRYKSTALSEKGDAFDKDDFDPVAYINELFPTEATLVGLDPLINTLQTKVRH
eukprot:jgi/Botrbrau1/21659/Bobra.43_1s0059.1